ncbi:MAG: hypothetical protein SFX18_15935 [Pirellulales bacterium]|nr:hypothetical protein [Pirellulales bacterium]
MCGYQANADHNAALNLHRRYLHEEAAIQSFLDWNKLTPPLKRQVLESLERELLNRLMKIHRFSPVVDTPF